MRGKEILMIGALAAAGGWYLSPHGYNLYRTRSGDSFRSLAGQYLGDAERWPEIYGLQSDSWRAQRRNDPLNLETGAELYMPQEAIDNAKDWEFASGGSGEPPGLNHVALTGGGDNSGTFTLPEVTVTGSGGGGGSSSAPPVVRKPGGVTPAPAAAPSKGIGGLGWAAIAAGVLVVGGGAAYVAGEHHKQRGAARAWLSSFLRPTVKNPGGRRKFLDPRAEA